MAAKPAFNPWPYGLIAFFAVFISCVVGFGIFAVRQNPDLVRPDYYEAELRHQQQMDRVQRTAAVRSQVVLGYDPGKNVIALTLPAEHADRQPAGTIHLYRPSDAALDRQIVLQVDADGRQEMDAGALRPGLWKARVTWRIGAEEFFHDTAVVIPTPGS